VEEGDHVGGVVLREEALPCGRTGEGPSSQGGRTKRGREERHHELYVHVVGRYRMVCWRIDKVDVRMMKRELSFELSFYYVISTYSRVIYPSPSPPSLGGSSSVAAASRSPWRSPVAPLLTTSTLSHPPHHPRWESCRCASPRLCLPAMIVLTFVSFHHGRIHHPGHATLDSVTTVPHKTVPCRRASWLLSLSCILWDAQQSRL
jgi:hypothetical protein